MYLFFSSKSLHPIGYSTGTFPALRWLRLIATIEPLAPPPSRYTGENAWHNKKLFERCPVEQCCGSESVLIRVLIFHIRIIRIRIQVLVCAENFQWVKHRHKSLVHKDVFVKIHKSGEKEWCSRNGGWISIDYISQ